MEQTPEKAGEAVEIANIFERKYADWGPPDLVLPDGVSAKQIAEATRLVYDWQESGEPYGTPLVLEIYARLRAGEDG